MGNRAKNERIREAFHVMYANLPREIRIHGQNVAKYACELYRWTKRAGLYKKECRNIPFEALHIGAIYHDAGMITVPFEILTKDGGLGRKEFFITQNHVRLGGDIAVGLLEEEQKKYWKTVNAVATCHHELWDGNGYPNGLGGTQIPLAARICAVADVYDCLVNDKLVHGGLNRIEAIHEVRLQAGVELDPYLAKLFVQYMKRPQR